MPTRADNGNGDSPFDWNPGVAKPTILEFINQFARRFDPEVEFWDEVVERLCNWFKMFGAILQRVGEQRDACVTFKYCPEDPLAECKARFAGHTPVNPRPTEFPASLSWETVERLLNEQAYEVRESHVPDLVRGWGVRNYMIVPLTLGRHVSQLAFLANAPADNLFDSQVMGLWEAIQQVAGGMAEYHLRQARSGVSSSDVACRSPLVRIYQDGMTLEHRKLLRGRYEPEHLGEFLGYILDECPRDDFREFLEHVLRCFLPPEQWDVPAEVVAAARSWPPDARANLARAYLALEKMDVANELLR